MTQIIDYGTLKTEVANELTRDDLTARIERFVQQGEARLFTDLRVREMEAAQSLVTVGAARTVALPTRYLKARSLYISGSPNVRLEYRNPTEYWQIYSSLPTAKPRVYTIEREFFLLGPVPDAVYTLPVTFYQKPVSFVADADTNGVLTRFPDIYLYAACLASAPFLGNDARILQWASMYEDWIERAHTADRADRQSGDTLVPDRVAQMT